MKLNTFAKRLSDLIYNSKLDDFELKDKWNDLRHEVNETKNHSREISKIIEFLKQIPKDKQDIKILDFGCGGCLSVFYLIALGYTNDWGVDIDGDKNKINLFLKKILNLELNTKNRISIYEKLPLDFNNAEFDFIFSQQVFEHVRYEDFHPIINEISRILKTEGITYNQIPHKLGPFDYHTKTWFLHWFPRSLTIFFLKILNKNSLFYQKHLWFRFPWEYIRSFNKVVGITKNLSNERITEFSDTIFEKSSGEKKNEFKGVNRFLRILIAKVSKIKIIGPVVKFLFSYFLMLEIVSKKK